MIGTEHEKVVVVEFLSVTVPWIVAGPISATVGVPLTAPEDGLMENPAGALVRANEYCGVPPEAVIEPENGDPTVACCGKLQAVVRRGGATLIEQLLSTDCPNVSAVVIS